jgi:hypothetical protein
MRAMRSAIASFRSRSGVRKPDRPQFRRTDGPRGDGRRSGILPVTMFELFDRAQASKRMAIRFIDDSETAHEKFRTPC